VNAYQKKVSNNSSAFPLGPQQNDQDQWAHTVLSERKKKEKKHYVGSENTPYIDEGKGDTLARRAVSLLHQGE